MLTQAAQDVLAERQRQVDKEGFTSEHDSRHQKGDMSEAAACYAARAYLPDYMMQEVPFDWPWDDFDWKPASPRRMLVKAAALLLAEIERLDRNA